MLELVLILDNIRSALNVGAIARTAEGLGVKRIYTLGLTPYPTVDDDGRLPHVAQRAERQIAKTALGAEKYLKWQPADEAGQLLAQLNQRGYQIVALEQDERAKPLTNWRPRKTKVALIVGHETKGVGRKLLDGSHDIVFIPMRGKKESFNVAAAAAMALFYLRQN